MNIVMVAAECAPVAKVGGLGDVIHGLSRALATRGHAVEIVLPRYATLAEEWIDDLHKAHADLRVPFHDRRIHCDVYSARVDGLDCWFIDPRSEQRFFERERIYGEADDVERFAFFSRAVLEFLHQSGRTPEVIHCHDWQSGLVPVLLDEIYAGLGMTRPRVCYTLHNPGHQGIADAGVLRQVGLEPNAPTLRERLRDPGDRASVNLMKGGILYAHFVTTVSPRHADEVRSSELGFGLQGSLAERVGRFGGILNGVDYERWNPQTDPHIPASYSADTLVEKYRNKEALRWRLGLRDADRPLVAAVSRLMPQKGVELLRHAAFYSVANQAQFVLLGDGDDEEIMAEFRGLREYLADHPDCHLELGFDEALAHLIYAGADILVVPSRYEPCGLSQLIAMRYGTVPVVRNTGGLADTVFDANYSERPFEARNGFLFNDLDAPGLESALGRAIKLWHLHPEYFRQLRVNGMAYDSSWNRSAEAYLGIFEKIRSFRG
ncbi:glycogen synthase [Endothiovibrio diazotrophicus]